MRIKGSEKNIFPKTARVLFIILPFSLTIGVWVLSCANSISVCIFSHGKNVTRQLHKTQKMYNKHILSPSFAYCSFILYLNISLALVWNMDWRKVATEQLCYILRFKTGVYSTTIRLLLRIQNEEKRSGRVKFRKSFRFTFNAVEIKKLIWRFSETALTPWYVSQRPKTQPYHAYNERKWTTTTTTEQH